MKKKLTIALALVACALPATAQNWSIGVRSGAFVFGDFVERNLQPAAGDPTAEPIRLTLTAETSPGLSVDLEHSFAPRWAVRLEGTFTHASLAVEDSTDEEADIHAGDLDVTTFMVPLVFRINPNGSFRFHLFGGPAYAIYKFEPPERSAGIPFGGETRSAWGAAVGGGLTWQIRESFGIEGAISDIVTTSPFDRSDLPPGPGITLPKPHNVHTTVGIRYRF
jgi:opacity protein-like surface antigen